MAKPDIQIRGKIIEGSFHPGNKYDWQTAMVVYANQEVTVTVGKVKKKRSIPQNSYLFGGPYKAISEHTGQDKESVHAFFKDRFLKTFDKGPIPTVRETSKLSTAEFIDYYRKVIQFAAEFFGLYIPEPNEEEMWNSIMENGDR